MPRESGPKRHQRANQIVQLLKKHYPDAHCALQFETPEQLLFATILSAQCTDERVNQVTKILFRRCPTPFDILELPESELQEIVRPTGFFRNKAKSLRQTARILVERFHGRVPQDFDELVKLSGVGRKTANVVMGNAFGEATGIVVDTHVGRLSRRLGLTRLSDPVKVEADLESLIPKAEWIQFSHWLIEHGRRVCRARSPRCEKCFLEPLCPKKIE